MRVHQREVCSSGTMETTAQLSAVESYDSIQEGSFQDDVEGNSVQSPQQKQKANQKKKKTAEDEEVGI